MAAGTIESMNSVNGKQSKIIQTNRPNNNRILIDMDEK